MTDEKLKAKRDELATKYRDDDLAGNPNGYTVSSYVNSDTTSTAFESGFDAAVLLAREGYCPDSEIKKCVDTVIEQMNVVPLSVVEKLVAGLEECAMQKSDLPCFTVARNILSEYTQWKESQK